MKMIFPMIERLIFIMDIKFLYKMTSILAIDLFDKF